MGFKEHKSKAPKSVGVLVVTVSDSRDVHRDYSGLLIKRMLEESGHKICDYNIVTDDPDGIRSIVAGGVEDASVDVVILNGGTGISSRDSTYEVINSMLDKRIEGFGELFRSLSYVEIGSAAILSRAIAGTVGRTVIISIPGSESAVDLAMKKIILPEISHMVYEVSRT